MAETQTVPREEPLLTIRREVVGMPGRPPFPWAAIVTGGLALLGVIVLAVSGNVTLPFDRVVTVEVLAASKSEYFNDPVVQRVLLRHGLRPHVTSRGSWEIAEQDLDGYDLVFVSGAGPATHILDVLSAQGRLTTTYKPFTAPLVLAGFREHAEALRTAGVATGGPLYYTLDMTSFFDLVAERRRWSDLGLRSENRVGVFTPRICRANSAATFMALAAFVRHGMDVPRTEAEATKLAEQVTPLVNAVGEGSEDLLVHYKRPEGRDTPIIAIYEDQFLSYQLEHREQLGAVDAERVLFYPSVSVPTEPTLIPLRRPLGERVGELLRTDPDLRRRATELGYRLTSRDSALTPDPLPDHLRDRGIPEPPVAEEGGTTLLSPRQNLLEQMIGMTGGC
ncbi:hypothetical protein J2S43_004038 [Catenuloplanes nepalensis]|uniref:Extracellular solute-binding protein n=1 Tax=Catenuloplanes nepalensis TaxID=587533 RepID=A0ABT9MW87_9ACTN|nr:hypothetical protein [Catenuloplanes nepalensis]MDP9795526.1 hypothetical protein [Catenuloplanes nepalensis]